MDPRDPSFTDVANRYRRQTLSILAEERSLCVSDLASRIVSHPSNSFAPDADETQTRNVRLALCHVHLPKLDESGLVSYAHESGEVTLTAAIDENLPALTGRVRATFDESTIIGNE